MNSWPSVSVTATADGRTEAAADADAGAASEGDAAAEGAAAEAAADGDDELPPVHAARNAASPAKPVPARKPRRFTFARAIRASSASSSRSFSVIPFLLLPARRVDRNLSPRGRGSLPHASGPSQAPPARVPGWCSPPTGSGAGRPAHRRGRSGRGTPSALRGT